MLSLSFSLSFLPSTVVAVALVTDILKSETLHIKHVLTLTLPAYVN